jgi:hypothetical protein
LLQLFQLSFDLVPFLLTKPGLWQKLQDCFMVFHRVIDGLLYAILVPHRILGSGHIGEGEA